MSERECDCPDWWHDFDDEEIGWECVPPPAPRKCCGRLDGVEDDVRMCRNGRCSAWYCPCGAFTGSSAGPVMCGCEYDLDEVENGVDGDE